MKLFLVGGFLGSGKTTAIHQAVNYLGLSGKMSGVITNDQGTQQVDTQYLRFYNIPVEEVSGGCFCCNLRDLDKNIQSLLKTHLPDALFAESVGSCTDLIATVVNPLLNEYKSQLEITLSVFADIQVLLTFLQGQNSFHDNINYIYEKQLEEAEIIIINKIDLLSIEQLKWAKKLIKHKYGHKKIVFQNSLKLKGISSWVRTVLVSDKGPSLRPTLQLDYDKYGAGEAEMAWLDEEIGILTNDKNAIEAGILFIKNIHAKIVALRYPIGHLKFLLNDGQTQRKMSYTSIMQPEVRIKNNRFKTNRVVLLINARIQADPAQLSEIISSTILELEFTIGCRIIGNKLSSFKPGYPIPCQRISI
ncbi:MAG: GTP-binding protein [Ferruginibacter sp.]